MIGLSLLLVKVVIGPSLSKMSLRIGAVPTLLPSLSKMSLRIGAVPTLLEHHPTSTGVPSHPGGRHRAATCIYMYIFDMQWGSR